MTIYDLLYVMDNMCHDIVVQNDARIEDDSYEPFRGSVDEFKSTDLWDDLQDEEVTDLFTEKDGTLWICYYNDDEVN